MKYKEYRNLHHQKDEKKWIIREQSVIKSVLIDEEDMKSDGDMENRFDTLIPWPWPPLQTVINGPRGMKLDRDSLNRFAWLANPTWRP